MKNSAGKFSHSTSQRGRIRAAVASTLIGTLLSFSAVTAQAQKYTILRSFKNRTVDGGFSEGRPLVDRAGNLYGTTFLGGTAGMGVLFKLDSAGNETVLHNFTGTGTGDGGSPAGWLIGDKAGNLFGTTGQGGTSNDGTVYRFNVGTGGYDVLHRFGPSPDGVAPTAGLVMDGLGNLYGTTAYGGSHLWGTIFKLDPAGMETVLYNFTKGTDGGVPLAGLFRDDAGNLYGTTANGGDLGCSCGVVYKLAPNGVFTVLYRFTGFLDGQFPDAEVIGDKQGNLYGTTTWGGANGLGSIFKVEPSGTETILHSFNDDAAGYGPFSGLLLDEAGSLYGTTYFTLGSVFKLDVKGKFTVLHQFSGPPDGQYAFAGLALDQYGSFYGATYGGGPTTCGNDYGCGVVFKLSPPKPAP